VLVRLSPVNNGLTTDTEAFILAGCNTHVHKSTDKKPYLSEATLKPRSENKFVDGIEYVARR